MNFPAPLILFFAIILSACGGEATSPAAPGDSPLKGGSPGEGVAVTDLPDPCALLTAEAAQQILQISEVEQHNLQNEQAVSRICNYRGKGDQAARVILVSLGMYGADTMSSATDSREKLVAMASKLAGGLEPSNVRDDVGNIAFVFNQDSATRLQVLTGMGGSADGSDRAASELQLGYAINRDDLEPVKREALLVDLARGHLQLITAAAEL